MEMHKGVEELSVSGVIKEGLVGPYAYRKDTHGVLMQEHFNC